MPILSVVSSSAGSDSLRANVDFAVRHGFSAVELDGTRHGADSLSDADLSFVMAAASERSMVFNLHFAHGALPASHRASVQQETMGRFLRDLDFVQRIGGHVMVIHPGMIDVPTLSSPEDASEVVRRESVRNLERFLGRAAAEAASRGVTICVENQTHVPGRVLQSYEDLARVVDGADHDNVGVALDVGHCIIGDGLSEAIGVLGDRIRHLHLNDAVDGSEHKEIGIGELDLDEMSSLVSGDFDIRFAALEVGGHIPDGPGIILRSREVLQGRYDSLR